MTIAPTGLRHGPAHDLAFPAVIAALLAVGLGVLIGYWIFGGSTSSTSGGSTHGSGHAAAQTRSVGAFTGVELAGSNIVTVRVGAPRSVVVHADDNLLSEVTTDVRAGQLVVGETGSFTTKTPMRVDVTTPSLGTVVLSGSGIVTVTGMSGQAATIELPGSGIVRASGTVTRLDASVAGSGDAELQGLTAKAVHATVEGSGRIVVTATGSLDASVPGSGVIVYAGNPAQVTTHVTGSGAVVRGG